jgi:hypothetical protein
MSKIPTFPAVVLEENIRWSMTKTCPGANNGVGDRGGMMRVLLILHCWHMMQVLAVSKHASY